MAESFLLPDGLRVGTGCNVDPLGQKLRAAPFPDSLMLEDKEIERLMKTKSLQKDRARRSSMVINQGQIGSCNWAMIAAMMMDIDASAGRAKTFYAWEYGYAKTNRGADNGSLLIDGMNEAMTGGVPDRKFFPYEKFRISDCPNVSAAAADALNNRLHEPYVLPTDFASYCRALASALARDMVAGIAWHVSSASMRLKNGYAQVGRGSGNHATKLHSCKWVGGKTLVHPDLQNSWGPTQDPRLGRVTKNGWGEGGFGMITMEDLFSTRQFHEHYVMTSVRMKNPI